MLAKIREELGELQIAMDGQDPEAVSEEMGDLLFSVVNLARFREIDPEILMAAANRKFETRFAEMETILKASGLTLEAATSEQMEAAWEVAKNRSHGRADSALP